MANKNYLTVVFEYDEGAQLPKDITAAFADDQKYPGVRITAVSLEDEISRVEELEQQLEGKVGMSTVIFEPSGCETHPNIAAVEGFLGGVGRLCFEDGTVQFAENETYPEIVYSPRLTEDKLESFCKDNIGHYEQYFESNFDAIDAGNDLPPIERFWE